MDLRQLRIFCEVARLESFTRAAESLRLAQPAVSISVRKLEEELELILLNRQEKRITLTAEGERLFAHAQRILEECTAAQREMAELKGFTGGEVRIGLPPMMSSYYFPRLIRDFRRRYPQLKISINGEGAANLQQSISRGEIDMGVIAGHKVAPGLESVPFLREEVVACVPVGHPLAQQRAITPAEFLRQPLIVYQQGYYMRELVDELIATTALPAQIIFESNLFSMSRALTKEGLGVSTFLRMAVSEDPELVTIPFDPPRHLDFVIAWKANRYLSRANRAFIDFLLEQRRGVMPQS
jgi:DNA-binding transcriptional LysR family regulator